ncbi:MAG: DUF433 domain-containing protein [Acidobacteria bacterium]|nr:DUF433 domain-containing protein [Acidobacteriota bacterium]
MIVTSNNDALIIETPRGPSLAGTRITVYSVMDYLKGNWSRNFITQIMRITDEQLDAVLAYIAEHKEEVEREYAAILRREEELRAHYEKVYWERSRFTPDTPPEERRKILIQIIEEKKKASQADNGNHDSAGSQP